MKITRTLMVLATPLRTWGGRVYKIYIFLFLLTHKFYTKICSNWFSRSKEEAENVQNFTTDARRITNDDGRKQAEIGHPCDSGNLEAFKHLSSRNMTGRTTRVQKYTVK